MSLFSNTLSFSLSARSLVVGEDVLDVGGVDEVGVDEVGVDEVGVDEVGVDVVGVNKVVLRVSSDTEELKRGAVCYIKKTLK